MYTNNKKNVLVSILIPLYNAEQYIEETITKALQQTYSNIELVIVDDHSTDNSLKIAQKYASEIVHIYSNPKKGGNSARNYAFEKCQGEYVKFMDADDYCTNDMIEKQMERILKDGDKNTLVFSPVKMLYPDGRLFLPPRKIDKDYAPGIEFLIDMWAKGGFNCPHCHLMHRSLVEKSGGWDESVIKNQDGEFFSRLYSLSTRILCCKNVYAIWRQTSNGVSKQLSLTAIKSAYITIEKAIELLFQYQNTQRIKEISGRRIGDFIYGNYPRIKPFINEIYVFAHINNIKIIYPKRKILYILTLLIGRLNAISLINKYKL